MKVVMMMMIDDGASEIEAAMVMDVLLRVPPLDPWSQGFSVFLVFVSLISHLVARGEST
jgi:hypothetical protein